MNGWNVTRVDQHRKGRDYPMATLLIVEDDPNISRLYGKYMAHPGLEIFHATDCKSALEDLEALSPDILVLDMNLPDGNGLSIIDYCQADAQLAATRIVVVSGNDQFRSYIEQRGIEYFLCKPVSVSMLSRLVRRLTGLQRESERLRFSTMAMA